MSIALRPQRVSMLGRETGVLSNLSIEHPPALVRARARTALRSLPPVARIASRR
jgi:hypothetical protein